MKITFSNLEVDTTVIDNFSLAALVHDGTSVLTLETGLYEFKFEELDTFEFSLHLTQVARGRTSNSSYMQATLYTEPRISISKVNRGYNLGFKEGASEMNLKLSKAEFKMLTTEAQSACFQLFEIAGRPYATMEHEIAKDTPWLAWLLKQ